MTEQRVMSQEPQDVPLPPPDLTSLISGLASQAMISLGVFPNPLTGTTTMMLNQAGHLIDMVNLVYDKTLGNRTEGETKMMESLLHELRMLFLAAQNEQQRRTTNE